MFDFTDIDSFISIAIDGPSGAGKSTLSKALAKHFNFIYVDTGAIYRTLGLYVLNNNIDTKDEASIGELINTKKNPIEIKYVDGEQRMFLLGEDVSSKIRTPKVSMAASDISSLFTVRRFLFNMQRDLALKNNVIMDGRDIGTIVLPDASLKIFLTANPKSRAKRRFDELKAKGIEVSYDDVLSDIIKRDFNDANRKLAPLTAHSDAIVVDTTNLSFDESFLRIRDEISNRLKKEALGV